MISIRSYAKTDFTELLKLLNLNIPRFFAASEEKDFVDYLVRYATNYLVVEQEGKLIGGGGVNYFYRQNKAHISWDFIHPDFQGKGIGKLLVNHRVEIIKTVPSIEVIVVRTSQLAYQFYEKMGFELLKVQKDFWAEGFDLYEMQMSI